MIDFPGTVSAVIFTLGCNFLCPYCHNHHLLGSSHPPHTLPTPDEICRFLQKRRNVLDGVVISGGEPTVQGNELLTFCGRLKSQGYKVKLDTNGSDPEILGQLLRLRLIDYVALDLKADPHSYPEDICAVELARRIPECVEILAENGIPHEFRVTCVHPFITSDSFAAILKTVNKGSKIFLQSANLESVLRPSFFAPNGPGRPLSNREIESLQIQAITAGRPCHIR